MTYDEALACIDEAAVMNPGPWKDHSLTAGRIAGTIARHIPGADEGLCALGGLLHDIGRRDNNPGLRHCIDGYDYLSGRGETGLARFCMTHAFPGGIIFGHSRNLTPGDRTVIEAYLSAHPLNLQDRIVQLSDMLASPFGPMVMEVRLVESGMRNEAGNAVFRFWAECLALKSCIEGLLGFPVYDLFDDVLCSWPHRG